MIENRAPLPLTGIQVTPVLVDASGKIARQGEPVTISGTIRPGERGAVDAGVGALDAQTLPSLRFRVDKAQAVEPSPRSTPRNDQMLRALISRGCIRLTQRQRHDCQGRIGRAWVLSGCRRTRTDF